MLRHAARWLEAQGVPVGVEPPCAFWWGAAVCIARMVLCLWFHCRGSQACCPGFRGIKPVVSRPSHFVYEAQSRPFYSTVPFTTESVQSGPVRERLRAPVCASHHDSTPWSPCHCTYGDELSEAMNTLHFIHHQIGETDHDSSTPNNSTFQLGILQRDD